MGRISHHLKGVDYKKTHQRKLDEQRALYLERREKEIQEQQYLKEIETLSQPYKSNWRSDLFEGMTTSGLLYTTLQATGETDLDSVDAPTEFTGDVISGHDFTIGRRADISVDYSKYDTVVVDITTGGGASSWSDTTAGTFVPNVYAFFYTTDSSGSLIQNGDGLGGQPRKVSPFGTLSTIDTLLSSGTNIIPIPSDYRVGDLKLLVYQVANTNSSIIGGVTPNTTFNSITLRRRSPLNVILGLDDPEATNFVRTDPTQKGLSAEERRKRLEGMLDAGDELLLKLGVQGSKARPADTGIVRSWENAGYGNEIAQTSGLTPAAAEALVDIVLKSPPGSTRNNAIKQLRDGLPGESNQRKLDILLKGV